MDLVKIWGRYTGLSMVARVIVAVVLVVVAVFVVMRFSGAMHRLIFGDTEAKRQHANAVIAKEQTKAEAKIADTTVQTVHERDVYHERVTNIVHESEGKVSHAWKGETVGQDVDAAGADALCRLHDSLCRSSGPAEVLPVR